VSFSARTGGNAKKEGVYLIAASNKQKIGTVAAK